MKITHALTALAAFWESIAYRRMKDPVCVRLSHVLDRLPIGSIMSNFQAPTNLFLATRIPVSSLFEKRTWILGRTQIRWLDHPDSIGSTTSDRKVTLSLNPPACKCYRRVILSPHDTITP